MKNNLLEPLRKRLAQAEEALRNEGATEIEIQWMFQTYNSGTLPTTLTGGYRSRFPLSLRQEYYEAITRLKRAEEQELERLKGTI